MIETSSETIVSTFILIGTLVALTGGCIDGPHVECRLSRECGAGQFCRAGECIPAVSIPRSTKTTHAPDADSPHQPLGRDADVTDSANVVDSAPPCPEGTAPTHGTLVLNEILVSPPDGMSGDSNGDGRRDPYDDEFVELVNISDLTLDLTGVEVRVDGRRRFRFPPICLEPGATTVVFGALPPGDRTQSPMIRTFATESRLGLSNSGGVLSIVAGDETLVDFEYRDAPDESLTAKPQLSATAYVPHTALAPGELFSPGTCADGTAIVDCARRDRATPDAGR